MTLFNFFHLENLLFAFTMFLAAGAVADVGAAGATNDATDSASTTNDAAVDTDTQVDDSTKTEQVDDAVKVADKDAVKPDAKLDARTMPPKVRETLDALKASDPQAHGWLKDRLFENRAWKQEFPGGLEEAKHAKELVSSFTKDFPGGIEAIKAEQAEWNGIDQAWAAKDPKVIDVWYDANPESFAALIPAAINKFAQTNEPAYQRYMSDVISRTLNNSGVVANLRFLSRSIATGDKEGAASLLQEITDWVAAIDKTAKTELPKKTADDPAINQREQSLAERESKIWANETAAQVNPYRQQLIRKEAQQYLPKGVTLDDETFEALDAQVQRYMDKGLMSDPDFVQKFAAYAEAKDTAGIVAFTKAKLDALLPSRNGKPGPVEKAVKLFFRGLTPTPKPTPKLGAKPGPTTPTAAPKGWIKVSPDKAPKPSEIDMRATPFEMRFQHAAILKDGRKIYWGESAPA